MKHLQAILESEILTADTKTQIQTAFEAMREEAIEEASKELEVKYAKKFEERGEAITAELISVVGELVKEEVSELKEDVEKYRGLEVEYATKLEQFKGEYQKKLSEGVQAAVAGLVEEEMGELKEDLEESKKNHLGKRIFEAFKAEYEENGLAEDVTAEIDSLKAQLAESKKAQAKALQESDELKRGAVMESLLSNLTGTKRAVMQTILESVETGKLEERYNECVSQVLSESEKPAPKKEEGIIVESNNKESASAELERLRKLMG